MHQRRRCPTSSGAREGVGAGAGTSLSLGLAPHLHLHRCALSHEVDAEACAGADAVLGKLR